MAETIAGIHLTLGPLLSGCYSIVKGINQLRQSYKFMPLTLSSIVLTCNTTSSALNQVNSTLEKYSEILGDSTQELFEQFDGIMIGCTITLSLLERHVSDLLDTASSEMPLKAQKASKTDKLKALYNESNMKELFGQLKDYNALLNTMLNQLHSDKQNRMMDMMTNQEKTLKTMLEAQNSLRRFLHDGPVDKGIDTASILSSTTTVTTLTAFDFDSIIKATAVYKRCISSMPPNSLLEPSQVSAVSYDVSEDASRSQSPVNLAPHGRPRSASHKPINVQHQHGDSIEYEPDITPNDEHRRRSFNTVRKDDLLGLPVEDQARSASHERIKQLKTFSTIFSTLINHTTTTRSIDDPLRKPHTFSTILATPNHTTTTRSINDPLRKPHTFSTILATPNHTTTTRSIDDPLRKPHTFSTIFSTLNHTTTTRSIDDPNTRK